jgi:hypothetical protein
MLLINQATGFLALVPLLGLHNTPRRPTAPTHVATLLIDALRSKHTAYIGKSAQAILTEQAMALK